LKILLSIIRKKISSLKKAKNLIKEEVIKINQALMYAVQSLINLANCDYGANKLRDKAAYSVMQIHEILGIKESV
jgi:hypothetical protein